MNLITDWHFMKYARKSPITKMWTNNLATHLCLVSEKLLSKPYDVDLLFIYYYYIFIYYYLYKDPMHDRHGSYIFIYFRPKKQCFFIEYKHSTLSEASLNISSRAV